MKLVRTIVELRHELDQIRRDGKSIGFAPTMGALHAGHCALLDAARIRCDSVVMSSFVNPLQFNDPNDFANYPRDEQADRELAVKHGADFFFAPDAAEIYRDAATTTVSIGRLATVYEGKQRPGHFDGVCTVVAKLLNIVEPDVIFLGQKDAQQVAVISKMVHDLDFAVELAVVATVRDKDGVALSSRNVRLTESERLAARAIPLALAAAQQQALAGEQSIDKLTSTATSILTDHDIELEYLAIVDRSTFVDESVLAEQSLLIIAAKIGTIRLLDNAHLLDEAVIETGGERNYVKSHI